MKRIILLLALITLSLNVFAEVDEFNTYRWNRTRTETNGPWFEWWYYKVVIPETGQAFYFVYGVVNPWDFTNTLQGTRAYVGMGDFGSKVIAEEKMEVEAFSASYEQTLVHVGENIATNKKIIGDITNEQGEKFLWDIDIKKHWTFNATGWATGRMITNIEWYPAQADASCSGVVVSNGKIHRFKDAPCYQDRNWGRSFPKWWAWIVSNKFQNYPNTTLAIGGGYPKFWGYYTPIKGVAIGLKHKGIEYTFRPNDLDYVKVDINFGKWEVLGINKTHKIEVSANAPREKFMDLTFMTPTGEIFHDYEALTGTVTVKLYKNTGTIIIPRWELEADLFSEYAGIEYGSRNVYEMEDLFNSQKLIYETPY